MDTTDADRFASYLDLYSEINSEGQLRTKLYDKRDDFNWLLFGQVPFLRKNYVATTYVRYVICKSL
jgi:hypothetical protein